MSPPASHTVSRSTPTSRAAALLGLLVIVALAAAPIWTGRAELRLLGKIFLYLSLATLWSLLAGYAGLASVGQQAYVGLGGYVLFALTMLAGVHPLVALALAAVIGALVAMPVAVLIFRLRGAYFAIGTWMVAEVFRLTFAQVSALGGGSGTSLSPAVVRSLAEGRDAREWLSYWLALGLALAVIAAAFWLLRSRRGLALTAIRDNELAARSLGIDIWRTKFVTYVIVGGLTSLTGALIFLQKLRISPEAAFSVNYWTVFVIFMVVIGGIGTLEGPIVGAVVFFLLRETLAELGTIYLIVFGGVAIAIMLVAPQGLWGLIRDRTGLRLFPLGYRVEINPNKGA